MVRPGVRVNVALTALLGFIACSAALACSRCAREELGEEEFDRLAWREAAHVFVATVTAAQLDDVGEPRVTIRYRLHAEEVFKGNPTLVTVVSERSPLAWEKKFDVVVVDCGYPSIAPGDRLLVFAGEAGRVDMGRCSSTRIVDGKESEPEPAVRRTIERLRTWSRSRG